MAPSRARPLCMVRRESPPLNKRSLSFPVDADDSGVEGTAPDLQNGCLMTEPTLRAKLEREIAKMREAADGPDAIFGGMTSREEIDGARMSMKYWANRLSALLSEEPQ